MKYTVETTKRFDKAFALCRKRGYKMENLRKVIELLEESGSLPSKYKPHKLSGFYPDKGTEHRLLKSNEVRKGNRTWECHIEPNWLLVWEQNDMRLTLLMLDTGTHADLFR